MNLIYYILLICAIGAAACSQSSTEPQQHQTYRHAPSTTSRAVANPTVVLTSPPPATATPVPLPTVTATPSPQPTPLATYTPRPPPTTEAAISPGSPEDYDKIDSFFDDFKGISFEADLDYPSNMSECDCPIQTHVSGWMWANGSSQMFARIEMVAPVERSMEVVTRNSFDMYLKDLDDDVWYFIPENTDMSGPLEDIMSVRMLALLFWFVPDEELEPTQDGYVWKSTDTLLARGLTTVTYDPERRPVGLTWTVVNHELLQARYFDLNIPHEIIPHKKGELLPDTYWQSQ